ELAGALLPPVDHAPTGREQGARERDHLGWALEQKPAAALVPLQRELDQAVEELRIRDPGRLEQLRVDARRGEARDRVQLVDEHLAVLAHEAVRARHAFA